jgi:hypothetical protein
MARSKRSKAQTKRSQPKVIRVGGQRGKGKVIAVNPKPTTPKTGRSI